MLHAPDKGGGVAEKTILVCDVCGAEPARTVVLRIGQRSWQKDLCEEHMALLLEGARRPTRGRTPARVGATTRRGTRTSPKKASRAQGVAAEVRKLRDR